MSKDFDLEPPKAPTEKKSKKSFLGKLFSTKQKTSILPEMPVPKETDVAQLRNQLGIAPISQSNSHMETLETVANATSDEESKQYDKEQSEQIEHPLEGTFDDAINEASKEPDALLNADDSLELPTPETSENKNSFETKNEPISDVSINPSLADEANDDLNKVNAGDNSFAVDDFSKDLAEENQSTEESPFSQEEIVQVPEENNPSFSQELTSKPLIEESSSFADDNFNSNELSEQNISNNSSFADEPSSIVEPSPLEESIESNNNVSGNELKSQEESGFAQEEFTPLEKGFETEQTTDNSMDLSADDADILNQFEEKEQSPWDSSVDVDDTSSVDEPSVDVFDPVKEQMDEQSIDLEENQSSVDESSVDESSVDESSVDESSVDESSVDVEPSGEESFAVDGVDKELIVEELTDKNKLDEKTIDDITDDLFDEPNSKGIQDIPLVKNNKKSLKKSVSKKVKSSTKKKAIPKLKKETKKELIKKSKIVKTPKIKKLDDVVVKPIVKKSIPKKDLELISEERKKQLAIKANQLSEKKFNLYLNKEEKITKDFLKREKLLSKYLTSEKQSFLSVSNIIAVGDVAKDIQANKTDLGKKHIKIINMEILSEQLRLSSAKYEKKLQQLYEKKYDLFSSWLKQESKLLGENLSNFESDLKLREEKLRLKQKTVNDSKKDVLEHIKLKEAEYKLLTRKIVLAEKKLSKKQLEYDNLISDHAKISEQLIDREVDVKAQESELENTKKEVELNLEDKKKKANEEVKVQQTILSKTNNSLQKTKAEVSSVEKSLVLLTKETKKFDIQIRKDKEQIKEKEKEIKFLDKDILARQRDVEKKEEQLSYLDKKQDVFRQEQKKSQTMLNKREQTVLELINKNEKLLRTIELKREALIALEEKVENEGFQSYLNAKLDQINPDEGILSDEEHILDDSPELGSKIHTLMHECRKAISEADFDKAKKLYAKVRQEYVQLEIPQEEKSLLYSKIREVYDDINLKMLEERSAVRMKDIA